MSHPAGERWSIGARLGTVRGLWTYKVKDYLVEGPKGSDKHTCCRLLCYTSPTPLPLHKPSCGSQLAFNGGGSHVGRGGQDGLLWHAHVYVGMCIYEILHILLAFAFSSLMMMWTTPTVKGYICGHFHWL